MNARYYPCRGVKQGRSAGEVVSISSPRCGGDAMNIRFRVELSEAERNELTAMLSGGRQAARKLKRAQILLAAGAGSSDEAIAACVGVGASTVYRTKRRFVEGNLPAALEEAPRPGVARKLAGKEEALLVATACASPPEGRARWTLELLADAVARLPTHPALSREPVRRRLGENQLKPWRRDRWCIPQVDGSFVARMEDVLDLYAEAPDPRRPVVCFDESPLQLIGEVRQPISAAPGQPARYDYEYKRNGTVNLFVCLDVHRPWRQVTVTDQRTAQDYACCLRDLVDIHYHRVAWVDGLDALIPYRVWDHAIRRYSGRPSSSMWFSTLAAIATSVACRPSVCERSPSPMTRFRLDTSASTRARQLYLDARCQPMRPRSAIHCRCASRWV